MKIFTIDVGNSRTHCSVVDGTKVSAIKSYPTASFCDEFNFGSIKYPVSWASVVPLVSKKIKIKLAQLSVPSMNLNYKNSPLKLSLKTPKELGQDRIAVSVGALEFFDPPYIVVDMGTAVTIDLVDSTGTYVGGVIAPGLHAFVEYLNERTAQLPKINPQKADFNLIIGKNTEESMQIGCVKGFCKLADGLIADIEKSYFSGKSAFKKTIFTGGSAQILPKKWLLNRRIEANLANIGLAKAYILNLNKS